MVLTVLVEGGAEKYHSCHSLGKRVLKYLMDPLVMVENMERCGKESRQRYRKGKQKILKISQNLSFFRVYQDY